MDTKATLLLLLIKKFLKRIQIKRLLLWKCLKMKRRIQRQLLRKHYKHLYYPSKRHLYGRRKKAEVAITERHWANLESDLGLTSERFTQLFFATRQKIQLPRSNETGIVRRISIQPQMRLWIVLYWMRNYPKYKTLGDQRPNSQQGDTTYPLNSSQPLGIHQMAYCPRDQSMAFL